MKERGLIKSSKSTESQTVPPKKEKNVDTYVGNVPQDLGEPGVEGLDHGGGHVVEHEVDAGRAVFNQGVAHTAAKQELLLPPEGRRP